MATAEAAYRKIVSAQPRNPDALHYYGILLHQTGCSQDGLAHIERAIVLRPEAAEYRNNVANVLKDLGRLDGAAEGYRAALALDPSYAQCHSNLGSVLTDMEELADAVRHLERAVALDPKNAEAYSNLGRTLFEQGRLDEAGTSLERALSLDPSLAPAHSNLGNLLARLWRPDEAIDHYRRAITLDPASATFRNNMATLLTRRNQFDKAEEFYLAALSCDDRRADIHTNYAMTLLRMTRRGEAVAHLESALQHRPDYAPAHELLGLAVNEQGRCEEAIAHLDKAAALKPADAGIASNRLFTLLYDDAILAAELADEFRAFGRRFAEPVLPAHTGHANQPDPDRRLRVGYVSPDFRVHAVAFYLEPLLRHHDSDAVEIYCYAELTTEDQATARFREIADHWRPTAGLDDEAMARQVREDRIDILVDYAGHTAGNRLLAFARKPAPVQVVNLIGQMQTTGIAAIDYVIGDEWVAPPGGEKYFAETVYRLPRPFVSFQPDPAWPSFAPLPAATVGHVTFASFNPPARISPACARLWARALEAVPGSRLLLKHPDYREDSITKRVRGVFADLGVAGRVEIRSVPNGWAREMEVYGEIDIAFDTWPAGGASTSCIALWMGVPLVSLATQAVHTRFGFVVAGAGFSEGAATSEDDFVARAAGLAGDLDRLAELRAGLRERMLGSPLLDHAGLARATEDAYRAMWRNWCEAQTDNTASEGG